jgi:AcrR family transcriptional regulator
MPPPKQPAANRPASRPRRPRTGRRPGDSGSRQAIIDAARDAFVAHGYAGASMRGIARAAGVDASLIVHFFGCKAGLFGAVVQFPYDPGEALDTILAGGVDEVGHRLAQHFVDHWEDPEQRDPILSLVQVAFTDPTAAALVREFITVRVLVPLMEHIDADRPELRAGLLASQIGGFGIGRYVLSYDGLTKTPIEEVVSAFGWTLQMTCTGPLGPNGA